MSRIHELLAAIVENDTNYSLREILVWELLFEAKKAKWNCGVRFDATSPEWSVVAFELPNNGGEIAWHQPPCSVTYDGHSTEQKTERIRNYLAKMTTPKCWECKGPTIPHPLRLKAKHPYPHRSFQCLQCHDEDEASNMAVLQCSACGGTECEWWYSLNELWEDMDECRHCNEVFCQGCYHDHREKRKNKQS